MDKDLVQQQVKAAIYKGFIKDARNILISAYKQRVNFSENANTFGGCFTDLPDGVTYYDVEVLLSLEVDRVNKEGK